MNNISRVINPKWYKEQMSGWTRISYILLFVGYLIQLVIGFNSGINMLSVTSTIAGVIGFTCTIAITNGKSINGLLGFISALLLIFVATRTGNYSDVIMQTAYVLLLDIPILLSVSWNGNFEPRKMKINNIIFYLGLFFIFVILTFLLDTYLGSQQAILDSISASVGLTGAVLTVQRYRASYYMWTLQALMSIALWIQTAINGHAVWVLMITYMLYLTNDIIAFTHSKWFK
ncbi:nicotinamide riboside transporter PnuC [Companilactobacillus metriopterae]|uniref:nicotinamide riboside transporter PnuC n=1 Tax=Companilactobacillus metriopterae TaxID=1909267 RepID=UPI00100B61AB|nr:nicotinamide riboside transporter PnuC [Companilactobacillus metriopterae]